MARRLIPYHMVNKLNLKHRLRDLKYIDLCAYIFTFLYALLRGSFSRLAFSEAIVFNLNGLGSISQRRATGMIQRFISSE